MARLCFSLFPKQPETCWSENGEEYVFIPTTVRSTVRVSCKFGEYCNTPYKIKITKMAYENLTSTAKLKI